VKGGQTAAKFLPDTGKALAELFKPPFGAVAACVLRRGKMPPATLIFRGALDGPASAWYTFNM
jgi:hypothetical protein